jgi:transcriptional regulator with XRE-family HTH domain
VDALEGVSATLAARRLGIQLRALRQQMKTLRVIDVAKAAGVSQPTWSQVETGVAIPTEEHLTGALRALEANDETGAALLALRERAKRVEWWHRYDDVGSQQYLKMIGYTASAVKLRQCSSGWVPGLLQVPEWARAVMQVPGASTRPENVDRAVELRIRRQAVLDKPTFHLHAICGEEALRYQVGGRDVQLAQLQHLLAIANENSQVTLQVTPFSGSLHLGHSTPYALVDFAHPLDATLVNFDHAVPSFNDTPREVRLWAYVFDNLKESALSPGETVRLIESIIRELL